MRWPSYQSFFSSHHFYEGLRATAGILIPILVAAYFDKLGWGMAMGLGALCVSLVDQAGPIHHRRNAMLITLGLLPAATLLTRWALPHPWWMAGLLAFFSFTCAIIGVFGSRAASLGTAVLVVICLHLDSDPQPLSAWALAGLTAAGGAWYFLLSIASYRIRPYKLVQQVLGDCLSETAELLEIKAGFYSGHPDFDNRFDRLLSVQAQVQQRQQTVRELLFKTREIVRESTHTGRVLVMAFLEAVDLFESVMSIPKDYRTLHRQLGEADILSAIETLIHQMSGELREISLAFQENRPSKPSGQMDDALEALEQRFAEARQKNLNEQTLDAFLTLRQILEGLNDLSGRLKRLHHYTTYDRGIRLQQKIEYQRFVVPSGIHWQLLRDNLHWESGIFRYSVRMTLAMLTGYALSQVLTLENSYWILLTIVVILKPAYALTRQRNRERLLGTLAGGLAGAMLLTLQPAKPLMLVMIAAAMIAAFSVIRTRYALGVGLITLYLMLAFQLLQPGDFRELLQIRLVDTLIGSAIALSATWLIPPIWERQHLVDDMRQTLQRLHDFLQYVTKAYLGEPVENAQYKWHRKEIYVSLAQLSDAFQRMLNEPRQRRIPGEDLHQFIVTCHVVAQHISTLGSYRNTLASRYASAEWSEPARWALDSLGNAADILSGKESVAENEGAEKTKPVISEKLRQLYAQRLHELEQGQLDTPTREALTELKSIVDQYETIARHSGDLEKLAQAIRKQVRV